MGKSYNRCFTCFRMLFRSMVSLLLNKKAREESSKMTERERECERERWRVRLEREPDHKMSVRKLNMQIPITAEG